MTGSLSRSRLQKGESTRFWLTVANRSARSIYAVRLLDLDAPGYLKEQACWCRGGADACWPPTPRTQDLSAMPPSSNRDLAACKPIVPELRGGQTVTVWGELRASESSDSQTLMAAVGWTDADKVPSLLAVPLGQCLVQSRLQRRVSQLVGLLKDLALPIVVGILGYLFQRRLQQQEQNRRDREKEIEEKRQEQERERTQLAETWNKMLPQSHEYAAKYYMPLEGAVSSAVRFMELYKQNKSTRDGRRAFYYWLLMERRMRHLVRSVGGFYFKDRTGEELSASSFEGYDRLCVADDENTLRDINRILDKMDRDETLNQFLEKLDGSTEIDAFVVFQRAYERFKNWLLSERSRDALGYLKVFRAIVEYEMNRPYEHWYARREKLQVDAEVRTLLLQLADEIARKYPSAQFPTRFATYLEEGGVTGLDRVDGPSLDSP